MDYLGNKRALADAIVAATSRHAYPGATVADVFAGTGAVSAAFATAGHPVMASDHLPLSVVWCTAALLGSTATFEGLRPELGDLGPKPYARVLAELNALPPTPGWFTSQYSPASAAGGNVERRYLTEDNAARVDSIRTVIRRWALLLTEAEHALLLGSLLDAVTAVSNVAGTYGCYLKQWKPYALRPLVLQPFQPVVTARQPVTVALRDAELAAAESTAEILYADPPYTKRQYAAYYHLLNTVATGEEPPLTGSTGLPDWTPQSSEWCYKRRAPQALERLVTKSSAPCVVLSYSSDGHIPDDAIRDTLRTHGRVAVHEFERRRYRSSRLQHRSATVIERVYVMTR